MLNYVRRSDFSRHLFYFLEESVARLIFEIGKFDLSNTLDDFERWNIRRVELTLHDWRHLCTAVDLVYQVLAIDENLKARLIDNGLGEQVAVVCVCYDTIYKCQRR